MIKLDEGVLSVLFESLKTNSIFYDCKENFTLKEASKILNNVKQNKKQIIKLVFRLPENYVTFLILEKKIKESIDVWFT